MKERYRIGLMEVRVLILGPLIYPFWSKRQYGIQGHNLIRMGERGISHENL